MPKRILAVLLLLTFNITTLFTFAPESRAASYSILLLSDYRKTVNIQQTFPLIAFSTSGKKITWKSSSSRIASVNTYGQVTAKKAGTCRITARSGGAEASCTVTVRPTTIKLSAGHIYMENGASYTLQGTTSNGSALTWKSSRRSVAAIDNNGRIVAAKPGETTITASADGTKVTCTVTVKKPKVTLNYTETSLYRKQTIKLTAKVSSGRTPVWKSKRTSVATVDENGLVTARKHGTTTITAKIDGITRICEITVESPDIRLSADSVTLSKGKSLTLTANVSSGIAPVWKSNKKSVATVDKNGKVTAKKKGTCTITATEDGAKESCRVVVK
ncbi:MAG: Ig-like domain-containing protein [Lachnospiraceae bacterium]|nr:Ig-like domain-containing protein [Lachnospiraceae bacterium]